MEWNRSALLSLARLSCTICNGEGVRPEKREDICPCPCVLKAIFRACYARFRFCLQRERHISRVSFEHFGGKERRIMWSRKDEEYMADFHLVSRRVLDPFHYRVFSYYFLLRADWRLCARRLNLDRGRFFHTIYRVQETLGRVFYELEPYSLYPPREYFAPRIVGSRSSVTVPAGRLKPPAKATGAWRSFAGRCPTDPYRRAAVGAELGGGRGRYDREVAHMAERR